MSKIVKEFIKYIGLGRLTPELISSPINKDPILYLKYTINLQPNENSLETIKFALEPLMADLLSSEALKSVIDPIQKENKELKTKIIELNKFKEFYELQYILNHGRNNEKK